MDAIEQAVQNVVTGIQREAVKRLRAELPTDEPPPGPRVWRVIADVVEELHPRRPGER